MGLADVQFTLSNYDFVYEHMSTYAPTRTRYGNLHLRENRRRNKQTVLRSLTAMRVRPGPARVIDGMISGPDALWSFEIVPGRRVAHVIVSTCEVDHADDERMGERFLREILKRVAEEQGEEHPPPRRAPGMLYLKRGRPTAITHSNCQHAIREKILDPRFLSQILPWGFQLILGQERDE